MQSLKDIAIAFEQLLASGHIREAFEKYASPNFRHHNPYYKDGRDGLLNGMEDSVAQFKDKTYQVLRVLEEGDLVAIHSRLKPKPNWHDMSVINLYRFEGDKIVELWDVGQQLPDDSPNKD